MGMSEQLFPATFPLLPYLMLSSGIDGDFSRAIGRRRMGIADSFKGLVEVSDFLFGRRFKRSHPLFSCNH